MSAKMYTMDCNQFREKSLLDECTFVTPGYLQHIQILMNFTWSKRNLEVNILLRLRRGLLKKGDNILGPVRISITSF